MKTSLRQDELVMPHNIEAEQALLGAILITNDALQTVVSFLEPDDFFEPIHRQIYDTATRLITSGKVANPITLKTYLPAEMDIAGMTLDKYLDLATAVDARDIHREREPTAMRPDDRQ
jgi:replicative DNA helicase